MDKKFLVAGAIFACLTVMIGAFGAHALKDILEATGKIEAFKTGVLYQMFHSIALLVLGAIISKSQKNNLLRWAGYSFISGIVLFSGSLYFLAISGIAALGAITPFGGVFFIVGWVCFIIHLFRN